jgi:hypothetical protein
MRISSLVMIVLLSACTTSTPRVSPQPPQPEPAQPEPLQPPPEPPLATVTPVEAPGRGAFVVYFRDGDAGAWGYHTLVIPTDPARPLLSQKGLWVVDVAGDLVALGAYALRPSCQCAAACGDSPAFVAPDRVRGGKSACADPVFTDLVGGVLLGEPLPTYDRCWNPKSTAGSPLSRAVLGNDNAWRSAASDRRPTWARYAKDQCPSAFDPCGSSAAFPQIRAGQGKAEDARLEPRGLFWVASDETFALAHDWDGDAFVVWARGRATPVRHEVQRDSGILGVRYHPELAPVLQRICAATCDRARCEATLPEDFDCPRKYAPGRLPEGCVERRGSGDE